MPKYGRGLNREIVGAVNQGIISEPFAIKDIKLFIKDKNWHCTNSYINVCLANGSSTTHSHTYKKYFESLGYGNYRVANNYKGDHWK